MTEQINLEQPTNFVKAMRSPAFLLQTFVITRESAIVAILAVATLL